MSNSTPRAALPPLAAIPATRLWGNPTAYYTAEQVEQIRRETVQACADLCAEEQAENKRFAKESTTPMYDWMADGAGLCRGAILALLPVKSDPGHSTARAGEASTAPLPEGERTAKHTPGPWRIYEARYPYEFKRYGTLEFKAGEHIEYRIGTAWDHPQLKGPVPVVTVSTGIGNSEVKAHHFVGMQKEDAVLIAAAPELLGVLHEILADGMHCDVVPHLRHKARAAIEKATGAPSRRSLAGDQKQDEQAESASPSVLLIRGEK